MTEPAPHIDFQGNERGAAYVRGVTNVLCPSCGGTGRPGGAKRGGNQGPWCRKCGGYGDVPRETSHVSDGASV